MAFTKGKAKGNGVFTTTAVTPYQGGGAEVENDPATPAKVEEAPPVKEIDPDLGDTRPKWMDQATDPVGPPQIIEVDKNGNTLPGADDGSTKDPETEAMLKVQGGSGTSDFPWWDPFGVTQTEEVSESTYGIGVVVLLVGAFLVID